MHLRTRPSIAYLTALALGALLVPLLASPAQPMSNAPSVSIT
jgi:hypothetical protein